MAPPDAIIIGAGLGGLSLAMHLAAGGWADRRVLIIDDQRPGVPAWGLRSACPGLVDAAATRVYRQMRVHACGSCRLLTMGPYRYQVVGHDDLRRLALAQFASAPGYTILTGSVDSVGDQGDAAAVRVDGRIIRGRWVFDSRPAPVPEPDARLAFIGWRIRSVSPVFD